MKHSFIDAEIEIIKFTTTDVIEDSVMTNGGSAGNPTTNPDITLP